tara:strand:+ start:1928 stop:2458 length:531 start_codon:yes stop_codon:yes gene_type:complete
MDTLEKHKYKYVNNMISSDMIEFLTSWSLKNFTSGDQQVPLSSANHSKNSDIYKHVTYFLLPIMERETNLKLKPIYSYNRIYFGGSSLEKHVDRDACEISASITLKYFYKDKNYKWPLCMGNIPIVIDSGDGVIYKGREIEHWRPVFNQPKEYWHHQLFIHYVNLEGPLKDIKEEN